MGILEMIKVNNIRTAKDYNEALAAFKHSCETCVYGKCGSECPMENMFTLKSKYLARNDSSILEKVKKELA